MQIQARNEFETVPINKFIPSFLSFLILFPWSILRLPLRISHQPFNRAVAPFSAGQGLHTCPQSIMRLQLKQKASMLINCFDFCSAPILLLQRDEGRHLPPQLERTPQTNRVQEKVSLRSARSLKFVRSSKNLHQMDQGPLSPRVSLKTIESTQRNMGAHKEWQAFQAFRNPFQASQDSIGIYRTQPQIKVHFCLEPSGTVGQHAKMAGNRDDQSEIPLMEAHDETSSLHSPSHASSVVFGAQLLSTITEEKQDLKSTHFSGNRLAPQGSMIKPKSVVSMLSSRSDRDSVLLERHMPLPSSERLTSLF